MGEDWEFGIDDVGDEGDTEATTPYTNDNGVTLRERLLLGVYETLATIVSAVVLGTIIGGSAVDMAHIFLAVSMNLFAIPLAVFGVLEFQLWVWYVISLTWAGRMILYYRWGFIE